MYRSFCFSLPLDLSPIALHISLVDAASRSLCTRFPPLPSLLGAERLSTCTVPLPAALHHLTVLSSPAGEPQGFLRASLCLPSLVWLPCPFCPRPAQSGPCQTQVSIRWWGSKTQSVTARTLDSTAFFTITLYLVLPPHNFF